MATPHSSCQARAATMAEGLEESAAIASRTCWPRRIRWSRRDTYVLICASRLSDICDGSPERMKRRPGGTSQKKRIRKIAYTDARNLFLTARGYGARFRAAAKWFTHRTSLTRFAGPTARRSWRRGAAKAGVIRGKPPPRSFLRYLVREYSLKRKTSFARVAEADVDHFSREIDVGKANNLRQCSVLQRCGLLGRPGR